MIDYLVFLQPTSAVARQEEVNALFPFPLRVQSNQYPATAVPVEGEKVI